MSTRSTTAFRPLRPPRNLTAELIDRLSEEITAGNLVPNQRLPTEQEMIATFGVSRTVLGFRFVRYHFANGFDILFG